MTLLIGGEVGRPAWLELHEILMGTVISQTRTPHASPKDASIHAENAIRQRPVVRRMDSKGGAAIALPPTRTSAGGAPQTRPRVLNGVIARNLTTGKKSDADAKPLQSALTLMSGTVAALLVFVAGPRRMSELRPVDERRSEIERKKRLLGWMTMFPMHPPRTHSSEFRAMGSTSCSVGSKRKERKKCAKMRKPRHSLLFLHPQCPRPHPSVLPRLRLPQQMDELPLQPKIHLPLASASWSNLSRLLIK
jgi:hypothetical protein